MDIFLIAAAAVNVLTTRVTPINSAEAVFAPFWDGSLRETLPRECFRSARIALSEKNVLPGRDRDHDSSFSGKRATFFFSRARNLFSGGGLPASA